jgi:DNA-binding LacI/PurR family transcriptional regulator
MTPGAQTGRVVFSHACRAAREFDGGDWFGRRVPQILRLALRAGPDGVFCVNDRIASVFLECCQHQSITPPPVIGHDNTPNAEKLNLTTIGLPWDEFAVVARELIQSRLDGYSGVARQVILAQRPVFWAYRLIEARG